MEILIVDDEPTALRLTCLVLQQAGFTTRRITDEDIALATIRAREPALVVLDISRPSADGFEFCRRIRDISSVPVIFVSARAQLHDRVTGLRIGGDDYLTKPFEPEELLARVRAVLRRSRHLFRRPTLLSCGTLTIDSVTRVVTLENKASRDLTPIEFRLLYYLMQNAGVALTTTQILHDVWGYHDDQARNLVAVYIRRLRHKLEISTTGTPRIKTISRLGYRFEI
jgi:DNA-binding response OmpR family regulator